jgi:hypothetical protein
MKPSHGLAVVIIVVGAACGDGSGPQAAPTVTAVSPNHGPLVGGTSVTITGTNFTNITGVTFGGAALLNVTAVSQTQITGVTPPGPATGAQDVVVTSSNRGTGHCATCFSFTQFPGPLALQLLANADSSLPLGALLIRIEGQPVSAIVSAATVPWSSTGSPTHMIVTGNLGPGSLLAMIQVADTQEAVRTLYRATVQQATARRSNRYAQLNAGDYHITISKVP